MTIAALEAVLKLYRDPDRLAERLPTLRLLTRSEADIRAQAERLAPRIAQGLGVRATVQVLPCKSQIGSGSLPVDRLPSACIAIGPPAGAKRAGSFPDKLAEALRAAAMPVIGRIEEGQLRLDLRCLAAGDEETLIDTLAAPR
jgi:L-seryl-tRNA(Ser) seleniumtransferase